MTNQSTEFETKVLNINIDETVTKLKQLNAQELPEFLARRYVFDLSKDDIEWIRVRQQGSKNPTMTYKFKSKGNTIIGKTIEIEVEVSDFDKTCEILAKVPHKKRFYQENKSHIFKIGDIEFSIDSWPHIPPYLEIESTSVEKVNEGLRMLGLEGKDVGDKDIKEIYAELKLNIHSYDQLKFEN